MMPRHPLLLAALLLGQSACTTGTPEPVAQAAPSARLPVDAWIDATTTLQAGLSLLLLRLEFRKRLLPLAE